MKYVGRKLVTMLITLLCISFLVYLAFDIIPGDAALAMLGTDVEPERLEVMREQMGLNKPFLERYALWLSGFVKGDFGIQYARAGYDFIETADNHYNGIDFVCNYGSGFTANWHLYRKTQR